MTGFDAVRTGRAVTVLDGLNLNRDAIIGRGCPVLIVAPGPVIDRFARTPRTCGRSGRMCSISPREDSRDPANDPWKAVGVAIAAVMFIVIGWAQFRSAVTEPVSGPRFRPLAR